MLGGNLETHMHMIRQQMPFDDPALLLAGQLVKNLPEQLPQLPIDRLATIFRDKDYICMFTTSRTG
jgi:hypothetical protein